MLKRTVALIHPKGTHSTVDFYYRGGDVFKEQEYLIGEGKRLKEAYRKAKLANSSAKEDLRAAEAELEFISQCTVTMAENFGPTSYETTQHAQIQKRINDLTSELDDITKKLKDMRKVVSTNEIFSMKHEQFTYAPSFEALHHEIEKYKQKIQSTENQLYKLVISPKYAYAIDAHSEMVVAEKTRQHLKQAISQKFSDIGSKKSGDNGRTTTLANKAIRDGLVDNEMYSLLDKRADVYLERVETEIQLKLAEIHKTQMENGLLFHIEQLNEHANANIQMKDVYEGIHRQTTPSSPKSPYA